MEFQCKRNNDHHVVERVPTNYPILQNYTIVLLISAVHETKIIKELERMLKQAKVHIKR